MAWTDPSHRRLRHTEEGADRTDVTWLEKPAEHDFRATADYLAMLADPAIVSALMDRLRAATVQHKKAKDIVRAARLELLPRDNAHVVSAPRSLCHRSPASPTRYCG